MTWVDYKKVYKIVPPNRMIGGLKMHKMSEEVINFEKTLEN